MPVNMTVANTIAEQIGGQAFFMMGTRYKLGDEKSLLFDIRGSRHYNKIRVTLDANDTYTVGFFKIWGGKITRQKAFNDVYVDQLRDLIESETGLYLSLGTMGRKPGSY